MTCNVFWGSHGCDEDLDHRGQHKCNCCPGGKKHLKAHKNASPSDYGADECAGTWPYYGSAAMSGKHPTLPFFTMDSPDYTVLPHEFDRLAALLKETGELS